MSPQGRGARFMSRIQSDRVATAASSSVVAHSAVGCGTDQSVSGFSVGDSPQTGHTVASMGNNLAPMARFMETVGVASERSELICPGLSAEATEAIINSRAVSTRRLYAFKWKLFTTWYRRCDMDPAYYPVASVLEFLQNFFSEGATPATLKVYVVAISANHAYIDSVSVGRHPLVSRFMQCSRRLQPIRPARVPSWDLSCCITRAIRTSIWALGNCDWKNPDCKDSPIVSFILPQESCGFTSSFYFSFVHGLRTKIGEGSAATKAWLCS